MAGNELFGWARIVTELPRVYYERQRNALRRMPWVDVLLVVGVSGLVLGLIGLVGEVAGPSRPSVQIDLSPWALPTYAFYSLARGLVAFGLSIAFTLAYGYWAARDRAAERLLVPLLDILQSIPVLGFMPGIVLALVALFPGANVGLELAAVIMIFTGQVWNMAFSFYHSLRSIPQDLRECAAVYRLNWWQRFRWVEVPFSMVGLVWNGMMSMAGGWFFLMINEAFVLGDRDFRLPGIGAYMSVAVARGNVPAMLWAIVAMVLMIVVLDQLLWRPVVVWAQKFRSEDVGPGQRMTSWLTEWLRRSGLLTALFRLRQGRKRPSTGNRSGGARGSTEPRRVGLGHRVSVVLLGALLVALLVGVVKLVHVLHDVRISQWAGITGAALVTLGRVLASTALGTLWALPAGLAIGLSPRLSRLLQPVVQVMASFPAPMLFPMVIAGLALTGVSLGWGSIVLMLLGTQWYILFNVVAGATAIPGDLKEAAEVCRIRGWRRCRSLYLPAVFPYLVTGWVTAAGGAWNASIVSEYVMYKGRTLVTWGLGARISQAAAAADFPQLAGSITVMALVVVLFNRLVWHRCYAVAEQRFSLSK